MDSFEKNPGRWPVRGNALQARFLVESAWEKAEVGAESMPEFCGMRKMERTYMVGYKRYGQRCWTKCCDSRWLLVASIAWSEVGSYCPRNHVWSYYLAVAVEDSHRIFLGTRVRVSVDQTVN